VVFAGATDQLVPSRLAGDPQQLLLTACAEQQSITPRVRENRGRMVEKIKL